MLQLSDRRLRRISYIDYRLCVYVVFGTSITRFEFLRYHDNRYKSVTPRIHYLAATDNITAASSSTVRKGWRYY